MNNLLGYLGDLGIHRLLVRGHSVELGIQLINRLTKNLISLSLCRDETLHDALQVRLGLRRWRGWVIWGFIWRIGLLRLRGIGWQGIVVAVGEVWMISPTGVVGI